MNRTELPEEFKSWTEFYAELTKNIKLDKNEQVIKRGYSAYAGTFFHEFTAGQIKENTFKEIVEAMPRIGDFGELSKEIKMKDCAISSDAKQRILKFINLVYKINPTQ